MKKIVANLKMNKTIDETKEYLINIISNADISKAEITLCLPFTSLALGKMLLEGTKIHLGAQNVADEESGSCTGEVSGAMLANAGVEYVIVGNSERRSKFKENNKIINKKIKIALKNRLKVILCVGETLADKNGMKTFEAIKDQLVECLKGLYENELENIFIAYEPLWAIGSGKNATVKEIEYAVKAIRKVLSSEFSPKAGKATCVLYGGSVDVKNFPTIIKVAGVSGVLVGKACLDARNIVQMSAMSNLN